MPFQSLQCAHGQVIRRDKILISWRKDSTYWSSLPLYLHHEGERKPTARCIWLSELVESGAFRRVHRYRWFGSLPRVLAALWQADFTIVGPHYLAKVAGETQNSRKTMKAAFKSVDWRFGYFFIGGALCVDIILPANNQMLRNLLSSGETGTGAASSFEIAMKNMNVGELPQLHLLSRNAYVYCSSCSLYGVALNGHAPKFLSKCTKEGLPIYCLFVALAFAFLSFLKLGSNSKLTNFIPGETWVTYIIICVNYLSFLPSLESPGLQSSLSSLPWLSSALWDLDRPCLACGS
ncbi:general amino acid permease agp2 [Colletotrichum incanum]|uniref:General amino acid permease agp2 n=1 Tax=Colletotrichum incanum TaxID=1573173 RepID=A0A161WBY3_COLIC|nr:general amino acid permease agp2 [Colletotrichum incanum]